MNQERTETYVRPKLILRLIVPALLLIASTAVAHEGAHEPGVVRVQTVEAGSAAEAAGVQAGDEILRVGERTIGSLADLQAVLRTAHSGDELLVRVEREGQVLDLRLTLGKRPDGGPSVGVTLSVPDPEAGQSPSAAEAATQECLTWIEETYDIRSLAESLEVDIEEAYEDVRACVRRDITRMNPETAVRYCDNVFKVHCSALDLLTDLGEAVADHCADSLAATQDLSPDGDSAWATCGREAVLDRYSRDGVQGAREACRAETLAQCREGGSRPEVPAQEVADASEAAATAPDAAGAGWRQWGGPNRDFVASAGSLAGSWPETGPRELWSRPLGEGYSAILFDEGLLYTMYREDGQEVVLALKATSGELVWEYRYSETPAEGHVPNFGEGPTSTPLIVGDRLFTVSVAGRLQALDKQTGTLLWHRELWEAPLAGNRLQFGYASSPVAYNGAVIVPVGGPNSALVALEQDTGEIRWQGLDFHNSYSSPTIVRLLGKDQLLLFAAEELISIDPQTGELEWRFPHSNQWRQNINVPVVVGDDTIFLSSPQAGARGLRLVPDEGKTRVEVLWRSRKVQLYHVSSVRDGEWVYGSSGTSGPAFMVAINALTGEVAWRQRGLAKANTVGADGKLLLLDENGILALATATPEGYTELARTQLLSRAAWTVPTMVGTILYARDQQRIVAVDLGS